MRTTSKFLMAALLTAPFAIAAQTPGVKAGSLEARSYAESAMLSDQEAARRINLQHASQGQVAHLVAQYKDRLAGAYWEDEPELRFVIRLKGDQDVPAAKVTTASGEVPVVIKTGAPNTIEELWKIVKEHRQELYKTVPGLQGIFVDERTGEIVLHVQSGSGDKNAYSSEIASLRRVIQAPVRIDFLAGPMRPAAYLRGGSILQGSNGNVCTGGFMVRHRATSKIGIVTAGHCPDDMVYYNWQAFDSGSQITAILKKEGELWDAKHDLQWHSFPSVGYSALGEIYGAGTSEGSGLSILFAGTPSVGGRICHRGVNTGNSCGVVSATRYDFPPGTCNGQDCDEASFTVAVGDNLACFAGDSGGPVYSGNTAYGIVTAAAYAGANPGQCGALAFMPIGKIADAGLSLY
ncbi:S1 family peptidase [Xanthomonas medicagonis]|uniref:S1 family peptidase n=1 Tax=Xanthomonas medicagonis TaxID=3160841 RepID=UPI00351711AD